MPTPRTPASRSRQYPSTPDALPRAWVGWTRAGAVPTLVRMISAKFAILHAAVAFDQAALAVVVPLVPPPAHEGDPTKVAADAIRTQLEAAAAGPRDTKGLLTSLAVFGHDLGAGLAPAIDVQPVVAAMDKVVLAYDGIATPTDDQKARRILLAMTADKLRGSVPPAATPPTADAMRLAWQAMIVGLTSMQGVGNAVSQTRLAALLSAFSAELAYLKG